MVHALGHFFVCRCPYADQQGGQACLDSLVGQIQTVSPIHPDGRLPAKRFGTRHRESQFSFCTNRKVQPALAKGLGGNIFDRTVNGSFSI